MLNLILLTAALSLSNEAMTTNERHSLFHMKNDNHFYMSIASTTQTIDTQDLEAEIHHQLKQDLLKLRQDLDEKRDNREMWVKK